MPDFDTALLRTVLLTHYKWTPMQVADLVRQLKRRDGTDVVRPNERSAEPQPARLPDSPQKTRRKRR